MAYQPKLIVQVARGSAVERQLTHEPRRRALPAARSSSSPATPPPTATSNHQTRARSCSRCPRPSHSRARPTRSARCSFTRATGVEPLVVVVEVAEELRDDELAAISEATATRRAR